MGRAPTEAAGGRSDARRAWSLPATGLVATLLLAVLPGVARSQETHVLVVSGLGGAPPYAERFQAWSAELVDAARGAGVPEENVTWLAEDPGADPERIDGRSDRDGVAAAFGKLAERAGPDDQVFVVLVGHGTARGGEHRINLPGRDLTAEDFAAFLEPLSDRQVVFVNTASASGGWVPVLAGPRRTVITATRSAGEANETLFAGYFAEALAAEDADTDKDGRVSVLEAFEYARIGVARAYEEKGNLLTEHALLDDDGDGDGSQEPGPDAPDGTAAARIFLAPVGPRAAAGAQVDDPVLRRLYEEKAGLETRIAELRAAREGMEREAYESELERLLVELTLTTREIEEREGGGR